MKRFSFLLPVFLIFFGFCGVLQAAENSQSGNEPIIIGTGLKTAVYSQMMQTPFRMAPELMVEDTGVTAGGVDNITALLQRKIDAGIVQVDVLDFMRRTEPMITTKIRSLVGLHTNYLIIFSLRSGVSIQKNPFQREIQYVRNLRELAGRPVAAFSSASVTARVINERLSLGMKIYEVSSKEEGFRMLREGKVYAFLATGGKYIPWVEKEVDEKTITLVNTTSEDILKLGQPYSSGKSSYRKFGVIVNVVAVPNELVCWDYTGKKCAQLLAIRNFFKRNLTAIQETLGTNPAWQEIDQEKLNKAYLPRYQPGK